MEKGKITIVSIPIGNLADITLRAIESLKTADYIVAEDTREAGKLIQLLELPKKPILSYRDQNHENAFPKILQMLNEGFSLALISDRGTPLISDPGYKLIRDLIDNGIQPISVPGPTAFVPALTSSGLPTDRFVFLGFLPRTVGKQKKILEKFTGEETLIIYESPFRVRKLLETLKIVYLEGKVVIASELTKVHEKFIGGSIEEVINEISEKKLKGEWVVMFSKK